MDTTARTGRPPRVQELSACAIIPARGGSKGIPAKNLQLIAGKPLLAHAIVAARRADLVERVVVSTDDAAIAGVAQQYGADVVVRPSSLATDTAASEAALLHALEQLEGRGYTPSVIAFVQCTSPLTSPEDIDGTIAALGEQSADCAFAVTSFHGFLWKREPDSSFRGVNHDMRERVMRQDREQEYLETGAVYALRVDGFKKARHRFFGRTAAHVIPRKRCFEVDEPGDIEIAEALLVAQNRQHASRMLPSKPGGIVFDFDGVFTDNRVMVLEDGREAVVCNRGDGLGLSRLRALGIPMIVISTETNAVVDARCGKLGLDCMTAIEDKASALAGWLSREGLKADDIVYVGNDVNDAECLEMAGCGVVVADAHPQARAVADLELSTRGGQGALRELTDLVETRLGGE